MQNSLTTFKVRVKKYDLTLLVVLMLLILAGLVILYSTSVYNGEVKFHDAMYYLKKQLFATALGLAVMYLVAGIDYHIWKYAAVAGYVGAVALSVLVLLAGEEYNGSKRWLSLGPFSFQPSEYAKVALILFLAWMVNKNAKKIEKITILFKVLFCILPIVGLVGASNLSTAIIILGIGVILVFVASPNRLKPSVYSFGLVTIGENSVIPEKVQIGKNTAISGKTTAEDYPDGVLDSGETLIKAGERV